MHTNLVKSPGAVLADAARDIASWSSMQHLGD